MRYVVILVSIILCSAGGFSGDCPTPPWSGAGCGEPSCGMDFALGYVHGGWSNSSAAIVIHAESEISLAVTWIPADGTDGTDSADQLGTSEYVFHAGDYSISILSILEDIFNSSGSVHVGAIWVEWSSCAPSYVYIDAWAQRRHSARYCGYGERSYLHTTRICPIVYAEWMGEPIPSSYAVKGCFEVQVPAGTEFVRSQFVNTSQVDWQTVLVDGEMLSVPPLREEYPQMTAYNFVPSSDLISVCVGKETPWSGAGSYSDACILSSFQATNNPNKERISIPPFPLLIFD